MLVYINNKKNFLKDVFSGQIQDIIGQQLKMKANVGTGKSERDSWKNSMQYMHMILHDEQIPNDCGVAIEFTMPQAKKKRIDFILSGYDENRNPHAIIIELKQWSEVHPLPDIETLLEAGSLQADRKVPTYFRGSLKTTVHTSYQAWSYKTLLSDFNSSIEEIPIELTCCSYLHNYEPKKNNDPLFYPHFDKYIEEAPIFCRNDAEKLQRFIKEYIKTGDDKQTLFYIENGKIKPSKSLQDSLTAMLMGNKKEFVLIDEQEIAFQKILSFADRAKKDNKKRVVIVKGGPGTGKTVVAINLLVALINSDQVVAYVTKNSAPRNVFQERLKQGTMKKRDISALFKNSGAFINSEPGDFDTLLVDEAHRLNEVSQIGPMRKGINQIREIINGSRCSVFFIDEAQKVTASDYGTVDNIKKWAREFNAKIYEEELVSQFRCNGSDGYLAWIDNTLGIRATENDDLEDIDYDFRIFDSPTELYEEIVERNKEDGKARLLAGYCWNWISKKDKTLNDIVIGDFAMQWNLADDSTYAITENSIEQIGCIHTSQGLEFSYVGVIIGDDLRFKNGEVITDFNKRAKTDSSLDGLKGPARKNDDYSLAEIDKIIRNTYRTLMTRGMKGCYVYCTDRNLAEHLRKSL
ncbi:MAG: DUF2075 domain-containing protein [Sphaerochaetaceae bacterium]|nr:DUF2075 domain-containing protein [Sphaerochaetaceae bacterium]